MDIEKARKELKSKIKHQVTISRWVKRLSKNETIIILLEWASTQEKLQNIIDEDKYSYTTFNQKVVRLCEEYWMKIGPRPIWFSEKYLENKYQD